MLPKKAKPGPRQRKWLRDLETTKAPQIQGLLRKFPLLSMPGGYCCLGRAERSLGVRAKDIVGNSLKQESYEKLGLIDGVGGASNYRLPSCVDMNDTKGMSFRQIAKHLRKNFRFYFTKSC